MISRLEKWRQCNGDLTGAEMAALSEYPLGLGVWHKDEVPFIDFFRA